MTTPHKDSTHVENHGSIPESAQYIEESTLIPESSAFDMSGLDTPTGSEDLTATKTVTSEASDGSTATTFTEEKKTGFDAKKNMPMMVVGAIATVLVGAFAYKSLSSDAYQPQPQAQVAPATQPSAQKTPYNSGQVSKNEPSTAAAPATPFNAPMTPSVAVVSTTPSAAPALVADPTSTAVAVKAPGALVLPAAQAVVVVPPAQAVVVVPAAQVAPTVVVVPTASQVNENVAQIKKLNDRVSVLEDALKAKTASSTVGGSTAAKAPAQPKKKMSNVAMAAKKAANEDRAQRQSELGRSVASYNISAIKDNLVWLRQAGGDSISYTVGDNIPGVGRLTSVNEVKMRITAGGQTIR